MSLFRLLFNRGPPAGLAEISANIFVFDHCFSVDFPEEDELKPHIGGILKQLLGRYSIDSFMVFNFEGGKKNNQTAHIFSGHNMSAMGYPRSYEGCPLLTLEMIHHFLRSSESWLSLSQDNYLLIHSEQGGWPILSFALAALLVYLRRCKDERKALDTVHRQAPPGLVELYAPLDPSPSQLRYLKYVSRRHISPKLWPPADRMLNLDCAIIRKVPNFDGQGGCRPMFRIYGPDPLVPNDSGAKVLFSTPKTSDFVQLYTQEDNEIIKVNVQCPVQGDIVMECISLDEDFKHEVMVFRLMFSTAFVEDNLLLIDRDQIDILWDTKHRFPVDFRVEVIFSEIDTSTSTHTSEPSSDKKESFSHLDLSFKSTDAASQMGLNDWHEGFDAMSLQETEISNVTSEHSILESRSAQVVQTEPENTSSSARKFEGDKDVGTFSSTLLQAESLDPNSQEHELLENASAQEKPEEDTITKSTTNSDRPSVDSQRSEAAESSDTPSSSAPSSPPKFDEDTDTVEPVMLEAQSQPTDTPSSSVPSSPSKFDEDTVDAGTAEAQPQPTDTPSSSAPSSPSKFNEDTLDAGTAEAEPESTELQ
ncbi:formin-like protein 6 [Brachypodium distachyon]|uniref:C2 tensin-type domain-containing protein n=1 Tax=Brachypodium distachyon TaxID=15368 RepID=I1H0C1_BRADI|nr:formin-like protein 6 [Brachypodium distachyon]KQK19268.1 hypothetical protein BRADI_1g47310v3 [Brachypodium distachyon]|eukprot:XP_010227944.1 formin-like protein 6 [Brachypodium distachyon]